MTEINFVRRLAESPKIDTSIYRLKGPGVNERTLLQTARQLGLNGEKKIGEMAIDIDDMTYTEGPFVIKLNRHSGALRYYDSTRWQKDDGESDFEMSDKKAIDIAKGFIQKSKLVPTEECERIKITHLHVGTLERGSNKRDERVIDAGVVFRRAINKTPVEGPGGMVVVYIDCEGGVTGCDRIWREVQKVHREIPSKELRTPEYAEKDLRRYWEPYGVRCISVQETRFGYFELGRGESQRFLQPAYIMPIKFEGYSHILESDERNIADEERMVMKSVHVVPAAPRPVSRIMPKHKIIPKEISRRE